MKKLPLISRFLPPVIWMIFIFWFSSQPDLPSNKVDYLNFFIKKTAHFFEYFILLVLWVRALGRKNFVIAIGISLLYAFSDETHQLFVPGRTGRLRDVAIDGAGILLSASLLSKIKSWKDFTSLLLRQKPKK